MDRRRFYGLVVMGVGFLAGIAGKATSSWLLAVIATAGLIAGGVMVAVSFRDRARLMSGSRLSLLASTATLRATAGHRADVGATEAELLDRYVRDFNRELALCEQLVADPLSGLSEIDEARERLMTLVASANYGKATQRGLIEEFAVRSVAARLANWS
ncbi:MAG: hypothetical protein ACLPQS_08905 [Acidimicrobiales bacterium]